MNYKRDYLTTLVPLVVILLIILSNPLSNAKVTNQHLLQSNKVNSLVNHLSNLSTTKVGMSKPTGVLKTNIYYKDITAYCSCQKCCGKWSINKKTANGKTPMSNRTVAASRSIPFGTRLTIQGLKGVYVVEDRLAARFDHRIDVYFDSHKAALAFGKRIGAKVVASEPQ
jgi:3D (Asp-Asp-Asp) domain-containing protein